MAAATYRDDAWQRLPWLLPAALALSLLSVAGFLALLAGPASVSRAPQPLQMQVMELPPATPVVMPPLPTAEPPPPPPVVEPEPLPLPDATPALTPPPKPRPRPAKPAPTPPPPQATAPTAPTAPAPPASPATPPDVGNMGARVLYQPKPEIPEALRHRALDLVALARFRIGPDGSAQVELVEPTPDPELNRSLTETLRKWRFFPELRNGRPVASTLDIRIPISVR